jgi:branched-chain amino acid aminotransferase
MRIAIINGHVSSPEEARISVYDRGFLYGDSIFETVRTYHGKAFALGDHLTRLARSAERLFIEMPVSLDVIEGEVERGIASAQNPESFARIMITRGSGPLGLDPALAQHPTRVILIEPFSRRPRFIETASGPSRSARSERRMPRRRPALGLPTT